MSSIVLSVVDVQSSVQSVVFLIYVFIVEFVFSNVSCVFVVEFYVF